MGREYKLACTNWNEHSFPRFTIPFTSITRLCARSAAFHPSISSFIYNCYSLDTLVLMQSIEKWRCDCSISNHEAVLKGRPWHIKDHKKRACEHKLYNANEGEGLFYDN